MDRFWPGPLTVILEKTDLIPDIVTAGLQPWASGCPATPSRWTSSRGWDGRSRPPAQSLRLHEHDDGRDVAHLFDTGCPSSSTADRRAMA